VIVEGADEERFLVGEVVIYGAFGDPGFSRDVVEAGVAISSGREHAHRCVEDLARALLGPPFPA
jgi:hypothetical protein